MEQILVVEKGCVPKGAVPAVSIGCVRLFHSDVLVCVMMFAMMAEVSKTVQVELQIQWMSQIFRVVPERTSKLVHILPPVRVTCVTSS